MTNISHDYVVFTAGEAERITGLSLATQRDWRRRRFLPQIEGGKAGFDVFGLCEMAAMRGFADRGIGPSISTQFAEAAGLRAAYFALSWSNAIEDNSGGVFEKIIKDTGRPRGSMFVKPSFLARFMIVWADSSVTFATELDKAFDGFSWDEKLIGAVVVMDLEALGGSILDRAGRALVSVNIEED